jgi:hypothetical protein
MLYHSRRSTFVVSAALTCFTLVWVFVFEAHQPHTVEAHHSLLQLPQVAPKNHTPTTVSALLRGLLLVPLQEEKLIAASNTSHIQQWQVQLAQMKEKAEQARASVSTGHCHWATGLSEQHL